MESSKLNANAKQSHASTKFCGDN